jgi:hypothetical protein
MYSPSDEGLQEAQQTVNIEIRNHQLYENLDESQNNIQIEFKSDPKEEEEEIEEH